MKKEDLIAHIKINDYEVDIGIDDYSQCYYFEYKDSKGNIHEESCGTYNLQYLEYIYYELDPIYKELVKLDLYDELNETQKGCLAKYSLLLAEQYSTIKFYTDLDNYNKMAIEELYE